jgi:hypothetical protein
LLYQYVLWLNNASEGKKNEECFRQARKLVHNLPYFSPIRQKSVCEKLSKKLPLI